MIKFRVLQYAFVVGFILLGACSKNPVTGKKQALLMSEEREISLGKQSDPSVVASFGMYPDETLQKFIDTKGQQMAKVSHRPELAFEFKILDSPVVNAFALPGGYVYFTRGILAHFNNEAEFAGVLGHEIGHVTARHGAQQQRNQIFAQVGLIAGVVLAKDVAQFAQQAQQGIQMLLLKNGRDHESQSDELGVLYSTKIGYDSHEMADFFSTLKRLSEKSGAGSIPTFLSTHPDPADRYNEVHRLSDVAQEGVNKRTLKVNREQYLRMIDGLVYGEDPKQGYVERDVFYHPELKFEFNVPRNWKLQNSPQQVQMAPADGKGMMIFTLAQGASLEAAANQMVQDLQLQVKDRRNGQVNGLSALTIESEQTNEQSKQSIRIISTLIKYGELIYVFHGLSSPQDFNNYRSQFNNSMQSFKQLTDQSKINVQPERVKIVTVQQDGTLANALRQAGVATDRFDEFAILNGMQQTDRVTRGTLIKAISGGR